MTVPGATIQREWPVPIVWAVLAGASLLGFAIVERHAGARTVGTLAIALAAIKIRFVFENYMDVRWQHRPLRLLLAAWLAVVCTTLLVAVWAA